MKLFLLPLLFGATLLHAQTEGLWEGYDGEWDMSRVNWLLWLKQFRPINIPGGRLRACGRPVKCICT